jgi:epoxyqueuosine reductase
MSALVSSSQVKAQALALGFNLAGIARAQPSPFLAAYERWVAEGMHGEMGYMARPDRMARRRDLNAILPGVRSLVIVGMDYRAPVMETALADPARGRFAAYAWGLDYHDVMLPMLESLASWLVDAAARAGDVPPHQRVYVDTGPLLERGHGFSSGLGFIGKNTLLIHPRRGSYFFLGELLTTLDFDRYDTPPARPTLCGTCVRCLTACPTDAFPQPHILDARRCISYLTIEHKGWIERSLRSLMGNWVYGCDVCQDVCPFQRFSQPSDIISSPALLDTAAPSLPSLLAMDEAGFAARFAGTAIERIKRDRLVRNACIAAGNWAADVAAPALMRLLGDSVPLVRGHAAWALGRLRAREPAQALAQRLDVEADALVREEIGLALAGRSI